LDRFVFVQEYRYRLSFCSCSHACVIGYGGKDFNNEFDSRLIRWEACGGGWIARSDSHRDGGVATSRRVPGTLASIEARHWLWLRGCWLVSQRHSMHNAGRCSRLWF